MKTDAEAALTEWAKITGERDTRVLHALAHGISKNRIHTLTGISRATIDRILERTMTTTTEMPGPNGPAALGGWRDFLNGGDYPEDQEKALAEALLHEQMNEFNALLPEDWSWYPAVSEIIRPADAEDPFDEGFDELLRAACDAVIARFDKIEEATLAALAEAS